ncbi:hypothetical protein CEXT_261961 [Caerostris extrusa]|uniref:Uncharacterized protein n=1 Tax=Caerostris extrusa TaxID=172846 RepID=A0AAV4T3K4_CAEEX|nr:hypothetical protein CEXT_261961 [Caerostris extrusa]
MLLSFFVRKSLSLTLSYDQISKTQSLEVCRGRFTLPTGDCEAPYEMMRNIPREEICLDGMATGNALLTHSSSGNFEREFPKLNWKPGLQNCEHCICLFKTLFCI